MHTGSATGRRRHVAFVMEQTLGHVAYAQNLRHALSGEPSLESQWLYVPHAQDVSFGGCFGQALPWALSGSVRALSVVRGHGGAASYDALFLHTQTIALTAPFAFRSVPVIVSLDATPLNFDTVGSYYAHEARAGSISERIKQRWYRRVFETAAALTTWSQWAKDSLQADYGVNPSRVTVVAPGVALDLFRATSHPGRDAGERPRVLFVGGDFVRKGGQVLLDCMASGLAAFCELAIVTEAAVADAPGIRVYRGLGPNDPQLLALYREADIFAFPTLADCRAVVLSEAMASGLPVVTTSVGAQPESVSDGVTGIIVPPNDVEALGQALKRLIDSPALRNTMGQRGRQVAEAQFDARKNARRLFGVIDSAIDTWHASRTGKRVSRQEASTG